MLLMMEMMKMVNMIEVEVVDASGYGVINVSDGGGDVAGRTGKRVF